ncbi:MAG: GEVED domain-containing protein, partial [Pirellulales bacterium]|nr:GEVED domain-containing protein [Pirellulales bacterium]
GNNPLAFAAFNSFFVTVSGSIGTSSGFGFQIPANGAAPADTISDGQVFVVRRGAVSEVFFELDNDGIIDTPGATAVTIPVNASLDDIADAVVRAVGGAGLGLSPENAGFGRVFLGGDSTYSIDLSGTTFIPIGVAGEVATTPIVIPIDQSASQIAGVIAASINAAALPGVSPTIVDTRVFVEGTGGVSGIGAVDLITIADEVGNQLQSNQPNGRTELTIFVGGGLDYGDAPAPYVSLDAQGGPRHGVDPSFAIGSTVSPDADAVLTDSDDDDGVSAGPVRAGFLTQFTVDITNTDGRTFYFDAWFDWNGDGQFDDVRRLGSQGTGRPLIFAGNGNVFSVLVPENAVAGEAYARFRLSEDPNLGPVGDADSGEVEDLRIQITNNPFQNAVLQHDVNNSGDVTPLDALQVINAITRNDGQNIDLSIAPLPNGLPVFPDVSGNGIVSAQDALQVINELARISNAVAGELVEGESVATSFVPAAGGVFASNATAVGDALISQTLQNSEVADDSTSTDQVPDDRSPAVLEDGEDNVSVFDHPSVIELDSIVDTLAEDMTEVSESEDDNSALDQLFASL